MNQTALKTAFQLGDRRPLDRLLRFAAPIQARYAEETGSARVAELRTAIYLGLGLYNVYNLTSIVLLPDVLVTSVLLRLAFVTPASLALAWVIGRTSPAWTERLVTIGILNAYLVPLLLFWLSRDPMSLYTFGELPLTIVFACMVLMLRFPNAVLFTSSALAASLVAIIAKGGLDAPLGFAFAVQISTACAFALYANYRLERRRCLDFLRTLSATLDADSAHADSQTYRDQSRTDPLTRLPNRRHLTERLEEWLSERRAVAVMMIDIDHFKLYNDTLGHPAGDDCLQRVAQALANTAAQTDQAFCARFGGEEFTFALRDAGEGEAVCLARWILEAVAELAIPHHARSDGLDTVTVSVGVARYEAGSAPPLPDILSAADRALYAAKRAGRNGYAFADEVETLRRVRV